LHGIVDSLWLQRKDATNAEYEKLEEPIEQATGFDISFEGVYKWLVFLPSKQDKTTPIVNRYFGCFEDGTIKDRGIETRRHDTPPLFSKFQHEALEIMAKGNSIKEVKALMPQIRDLFQHYKQQLKQGRVPLVDLIFTKMLSKDSDGYTVNTVETSAIYQLRDEGESMRAGEVLQYIVTDYNRKNSRKRTVPVELINEKTTYDANRYTELLAETCNSITTPFECNIDPSDGEMRQLA
jgi:DNA polymerase, archaea type